MLSQSVLRQLDANDKGQEIFYSAFVHVCVLALFMCLISQSGSSIHGIHNCISLEFVSPEEPVAAIVPATEVELAQAIPLSPEDNLSNPEPKNLFSLPEPEPIITPLVAPVVVESTPSIVNSKRGNGSLDSSAVVSTPFSKETISTSPTKNVPMAIAPEMPHRENINSLDYTNYLNRLKRDASSYQAERRPKVSAMGSSFGMDTGQLQKTVPLISILILLAICAATVNWFFLSDAGICAIAHWTISKRPHDQGLLRYWLKVSECLKCSGRNKASEQLLCMINQAQFAPCKGNRLDSVNHELLRSRCLAFLILVISALTFFFAR